MKYKKTIMMIFVLQEKLSTKRHDAKNWQHGILYFDTFGDFIFLHS